MKILILSDSHSSLRFMHQCINAVAPDCIMHLGDYYDDAVAISDEYPGIPLIHVPGNCDAYRAPIKAPKILTPVIEGVQFYLSHGHLHNVKMGEYEFIRSAIAIHAQVALYGHTHIPECHCEPNGLWVMNPGSCGYSGGSAGFVEVNDGKILKCQLIFPNDLEDYR